MSDIIDGGMEALRADPNEFRKRRDAAFKRIQELMEEPPESIHLECSVKLDASLATAYEICKEMFGILIDDDETDDAFVAYLLVQGIHMELEKLQNVRDHIYDMGGSIQLLADDVGVSLNDAEVQMAAAEVDISSSEPRNIEQLWDDGYIITMCPKCRKRAVWHPESKDAICLSGCGALGEYETRPYPEDEQPKKSS